MESNFLKSLYNTRSLEEDLNFQLGQATLPPPHSCQFVKHCSPFSWSWLAEEEAHCCLGRTRCPMRSQSER